MNKELLQLNFNKLLISDDSVNIDEYDFNKYIENGSKHKLKGYCTKCEKEGCNICPSDNNYKLTSISHGASADDIIEATDSTSMDFSGWHDEGVLFLMESPSADWGYGEEICFDDYKKSPSVLWYWIHNKGTAYSFPDKFKGGQYGTFFNSAIFTFKLKNAYLTNLVKCGMSNSEGQYMPGKINSKFHTDCITTCIENILSNEIEILKPKIIFCFGKGVADTYYNYWGYDSPIPVVILPHPSVQRQGFTNEFYKHLDFSLINEGLFKAKIISLDEAERNYNLFLSKS